MKTLIGFLLFIFFFSCYVDENGNFVNRKGKLIFLQNKNTETEPKNNKEDEKNEDNFEIKSEKVKTSIQRLCPLIEEEVNCIKKVLRRKRSTFIVDITECSEDATRKGLRIGQRIGRNISSESDKKELLFVFSKIAEIEKKYRIDKVSKCKEDSDSFDDMLECYEDLANDYIKEYQEKLC